MLKARCVILICLLTLSTFCQSGSKYQVGTITDIKPRQPGDGTPSQATSYDVSVRVDDTVYVVVYTPPLGTNTVKYAAGRDVLVLAGKNTITYNDILGNGEPEAGRCKEVKISRRIMFLDRLGGSCHLPKCWRIWALTCGSRPWL